MIAITTLFNLTSIRLKNYKVFRANLPLPLITLELSYDSNFFVEDSIKIKSSSCLWHKEGLLNLGIKHCHAEKIVCIDSDIINFDDQWVQTLEAKLDDYNVVQPFSQIHHLDQENKLLFSNWSISSLQGSFNLSTQRMPNLPTPGFVWAFRRDFIAKYGLYNKCIVGGGDTAFACAVLGQFETVMDLHFMNQHQREAYLKWATMINKEAKVGFLKKELAHLWHGSFKARKNTDRHKELMPFEFNPNKDVKLGNLLEWSNNKYELHEYVRSYFEQRMRSELCGL